MSRNKPKSNPRLQIERRHFLKAAGVATLLGVAPRPLLASDTGSEALVFDWDEIITKPGRYIEGKTQWKPNNRPVRLNTDWTQPPYYANGTYHVRVLLRKMNQHDDFKFIFNHWQSYEGKQAEATMTPPDLTFQYRGAPLSRTFEFPVKHLKSVHTMIATFAPFDWSKPRDLVGFFPPAFANTPASGKLDPEALPMDIRFTVVVVAPGATFSGWSNY